MEFSHSMRVYIEDTDAGGIVYYVNYLKFMERARTEMFRHLGFPKPAFIEGGKLLVISSASADYKLSARLDDALEVTAVVEKVARSYVVFKQAVFRCNEINSVRELLCEGAVTVACVKRDTMRPCAFPSAVKSALDTFKT
ncbi:MAG: 4-hydroxybenzoyl-CoA thioesterase [Flavobacteriales bacterium]|jgi:4-hydroxybenzoyl-CoA thioesterase